MLSAEAEGFLTNLGLHNFSYLARTEFNNCFIIYLYLYPTQNKRLPRKQDASEQATENGTTIYVFPHLV